MHSKIVKLASIVEENGFLKGFQAAYEYIIKRLPDQAHYVFFPINSLLYDCLDPSILYKRDGHYIVYNIRKSKSFAIPGLRTELLHMNDIVSGNRYETADHASQKYQLEGFVELDDEDLVVDVGGFIGAFSIYSADYSDKVILIDPNKTNIRCSEFNLKENNISNVLTMRKAISNQNEIVELNIAEDPTDHSIINPDSEQKGSVAVEAITLDELAERNSLSKVDFLKMDAEGFEREIIKSVQNLDITKIAIDCSPEGSNNDKAIGDELEEILENQGYETRQQNKSGWEVIYAKK